jgi:hypothetical protein
MLALSELLCYAAIAVVLDRKFRRNATKSSHADSIKNINELSFGLEDTTYTTVQRELRRFESYTVHKF